MQRPPGFPLTDNRKNIEKLKSQKPARYPLNTLKSKTALEENKSYHDNDRQRDVSGSPFDGDVIEDMI